MIKRRTAIAFLMLASLLLLAHAVVPHHHHNKKVCLVNAHCLNDEFSDEQGIGREKHSHDGENNPDDCVLKQSVVVISDQLITYFKFNNIKSHQSGFDNFQYISLMSSPEFRIRSLLHFISANPLNCSYSAAISASLGLRAPPVA